MSDVGEKERVTQNRVVKLFHKQLGYIYYGNWEKREHNSHIEEAYLSDWLNEQKVEPGLIPKAIRKFKQAASLGNGQKLYDANKAVYSYLRYGVDVQPGQGKPDKTIQLINWQEPLKNDFAIAEEVTVKGNAEKRPDIVLYVNGIALGVIELKRGKVNVTDGIQQNLDNQKKEFIPQFFTTMQLVMAGNNTEGLHYGTVGTPQEHYYRWREENPNYQPKTDDSSKKYLTVYDVDYCDNLLDFDILNVCNKTRFLELIHDFIVFDFGTKKTCRHNQYFGVKAAQPRVQQAEGGIIWHTQGSGKSLTMVWLAKWIREHVENPRIVVITDRTELDEQIEGVFTGVEETIHRTQDGSDLIAHLHASDQWLLCSLIHKFGRKGEDDDEDKQAELATDEYIKKLQKSIPKDFDPKGNLFVFVDECHRTQSGKLHRAMKRILTNKKGKSATFIGFTGTPLLKKDKQKSIDVFGSYIHTYKFDQAVKDGVILDLQYQARDIDQYIRSRKKIDEWFETTTQGLTDMARVRLKQRWGNMQKMLSSKDRLGMIVQDIWKDMKTLPRLKDGRGNAMLVCASIYQACKIYELFCSYSDLKGKCAIVTSYLPSKKDIKGQETGHGQTEKLHQFEIYQNMLADYFGVSKEQAIKKAEEFETQVKNRFKKEPGQMRLLIVVDKLLTGFDAPSATYLYIDKKMQDHGLFQAICRVNRLDGEDKEYGYVIDYKDLFRSLESSIVDYTSGAFDGYDKSDIKGLFTNRLAKSKQLLEEKRESLRALCEPVLQPKAIADYIRYFCGDTASRDDLKINEPKRVALYKCVAALVRAYANLANEMIEAGYTRQEAKEIKQEADWYVEVRQEVKVAAKDDIDLKKYEPAMRWLIDTYIKADDSETVVDFENLGLIELIVEKAKQNPASPKSTKIPEAMAETIENNVRKTTMDGRPINPKYYDEMSDLLEALIQQRREEAISYEEYLKRIKQIAENVTPSQQRGVVYPKKMDTQAKQSLYDNLGNNEQLAEEIDTAIRQTKKDKWKDNKFKRKEVERAIEQKIASYQFTLDEVMKLVEEQPDYD